MKFNKITSSNFRGTGQQSHVLSGKNMIITGANKSGKTRYIDRILWCLYGKDLAETSDKEILDINKPDEDVSVEIEFIDKHNEIHTIEKILKSNGTKAFKINNAPIKTQTQYTEFIKEHFGTEKDVFSYMIPYRIFLNHTVQDLRNFVLGLTPDVSNEQIYKKDESLIDLSERFSRYSVSEIIAIEKDRLKTLKAEKSRVQANIEVSQQNAKQTIIDNSELNVSEYDIEIKKCEQQIRKIQSANVVSDYDKELQNLALAKQKISNFETQWLMRKQARLTEVQVQTKKIQDNLHYMKEKFEIDKIQASSTLEEIEEMDVKLDGLRFKVKDIVNNFNCPICDNKVTDTAIIDKYKAEITAEGKVLKNKRNKLSEKAQILSDMLTEYHTKKAELEEMLEITTAYSVDNDKEYIKKPHEMLEAERELAIIQNKIIELSEFEVDNPAIEVNAEKWEQDKTYWENQKLSFLMHSQYITTINENKEKLKQLTNDEQDSESWLEKAKKFINFQATMKEDSLNALFDGEITWQLFREKTDGEQEAVCRALDKNGASHDRWSTGQRISLGILLIDKIAKIKSIKPVLLIDDCGLLDTLPKSELGLQMIFCKTTEKGSEFIIDFEY